MRFLFHYLPGWLVCILFVMVFILITWLLFKIGKRIFKQELLEKYKDITSMYANIIGVLYGIFLAFIVVAIWEHFENARENVSKEVNALGFIYQAAEFLPVQERDKIDSIEKSYINIVINKEWNMMQDCGECEEAVSAHYALHNTILKLTPADLRQEVIFQQLLIHSNEMSIARQIRITESSANVPTVLWSILIIGALILIVYLSFFYLQSFRFHLWLGFGVSTFLAILLFMAFDLNYPYIGTESIQPDGFKELLEHTIHHIDQFRK